MYGWRSTSNDMTVHTLNQWIKVQDRPPPSPIHYSRYFKRQGTTSHYYTELNSYRRNWNSFSIKNKQAKNLFARFKKSPEFQAEAHARPRILDILILQKKNEKEFKTTLNYSSRSPTEKKMDMLFSSSYFFIKCGNPCITNGCAQIWPHNHNVLYRLLSSNLFTTLRQLYYKN
jgi:hypothetical protein